jgi:hypothetical protein
MTKKVMTNEVDNNLIKDKQFTEEYLWFLAQIHPDQFNEKMTDWCDLIEKYPTFNNVYDMVNDLLCITNDNGKVIPGPKLFKKVYKVHEWTNTPSKKLSMEKNYQKVKTIWLQSLCEKLNISK